MNWRRFFHRNDADSDLRNELDSYLDHCTQEFMDRGMDAQAARHAAQRKLGNTSKVCEEVYRMNTVAFLEEALRNVRFSVRALRKNGAFAVAAILTIAIGMGANTAVFSVVDGVLLKPLAYREPNRLVSIQQVAPGLGGMVNETGLKLSTGMYFTYSEQNTSFESLGVWTRWRVSVNGAGDPEQVFAIAVSPGVLEALGVQPEIGHWFSADDQKPGATRTILLSHDYWQQRFGGDTNIVERTLILESQPRQVIGVMPKSFRIADVQAAIIAPLQLDRSRAELAGFNLNSVGRLKPGISLAQAQADIARLIPIWLNSWDSNAGAIRVFGSWRIAPDLRPLSETIVGNIGDVLWVVMGTLGAVMLIVCANVANLMLVHLEARRQEFAVRAALGAGRGRLLGELVTESAVLVSAGALLGMGLAFAGVWLLQWIVPANLPRLNEIAVDGRAATFTLAIAGISVLLLSLISAWRYGGQLSLRGGGRTASAGPEQQRARNALVVVQVSLALVLLISSGLMIRTFQNMHTVKPGFTDPAQLETLRVGVPEALEHNAERVARMEQEIRDRLAAIPGVTEVGFADAVPMDGISLNWDGVFAEGHTVSSNEYPPARLFRNISPGYFKSMGTRLIAGRDYTWDDLYSGRKCLIISENLAREYWDSAAAAIGKRINQRLPLLGQPWYEVIGVVEDVRIEGANEKAPAVVYWQSYFSLPWLPQRVALRNPVFVIRSSRAGTQPLAEEVRKSIWSVNGNLAIADMLTLEQIVGRSMARTVFALVMLATAGGMSLLLGIIGIYGVVSYAVSQHRREIGIRLALGAKPADVKSMFLRQGLVLSAIGCVIGFVTAVGLARLMKSLLFGVTPLDPITYSVTPLVLLMAAVLACYFPARRAASVDPAETLRAE